jgi:hypothetical protein
MLCIYCTICKTYHPCDLKTGGIHEYSENVPPRPKPIKRADLQALLDAGLARFEALIKTEF